MAATEAVRSFRDLKLYRTLCLCDLHLTEEEYSDLCSRYEGCARMLKALERSLLMRAKGVTGRSPSHDP